jgi:hypothetical protein
MNVYFHRIRNVLLYKKFEINCMTLCIPFDSFYKIFFKTIDYFNLQDWNDIYMISKLFLNILLI